MINFFTNMSDPEYEEPTFAPVSQVSQPTGMSVEDIIRRHKEGSTLGQGLAVGELAKEVKRPEVEYESNSSEVTREPALPPWQIPKKNEYDLPL